MESILRGGARRLNRERDGGLEYLINTLLRSQLEGNEVLRLLEGREVSGKRATQHLPLLNALLPSLSKLPHLSHWPF